MKWKMYLSKNTMYYEILVAIQSHADLYKTGCGGLPTKDCFYKSIWREAIHEQKESCL